MKARFGLVDNSKVIEFEVENADELRTEFERLVASDASVYWVTDLKGRSVGVPVGRVAFLEIDSEEAGRTVGFSPSG